MKKKLNLNDLKLKSFVTSEEAVNTKTIKAGLFHQAPDDTGSTDGVCCDIASVIDGSCQYGPGCASQWPNCG